MLVPDSSMIESNDDPHNFGLTTEHKIDRHEGRAALVGTATSTEQAIDLYEDDDYEMRFAIIWFVWTCHDVRVNVHDPRTENRN